MLYNLDKIFVIVVKFKPDIIHSWMYHVHFVSFVLSLFGYKVIWSIRNHDISRKNKKIYVDCTCPNNHSINIRYDCFQRNRRCKDCYIENNTYVVRLFNI